MAIVRRYGFGHLSAPCQIFNAANVAQKNTGLGIEINGADKGATITHLHLDGLRSNAISQISCLCMVFRGSIPNPIPASWQLNTSTIANQNGLIDLSPFVPLPDLLYYRCTKLVDPTTGSPTFFPAVDARFKDGFGPTIEPGQTMSVLFLPTFPPTLVATGIDWYIFACLNVLGVMKFAAGRAAGNANNFRSISKGALR